MPLIHVSPKSFSLKNAPQLQQAIDLQLDWEEILWAAITVGRSELLHVFRHGPFSLFELSYRIAIVYANLVERSNGSIERSVAYEGLDPSEKSAISYFLALTATKAVIHRTLNVPWLMHLDVYRKELNPVISGGSRPDLAGRDEHGRWIVVEAKGRTNGLDKRALAKAKKQASQVSEIDCEPPFLAVATQAHFSAGELKLDLVDPSPRRRRLRLPLSREQFFEGYYRPFREWIREDSSHRVTEFNGRQFTSAPITTLDIEIGLATDLMPDGTTPLEAAPKTGALSVAVPEVDDSQVFVGEDGVLVRTGSLWTPSNMQLQPQERS